LSDKPEKYRSAFGNVLYRDFLECDETKKITQKTLAGESGVSVWDISRMVSQNSHFEKGKILYDDMYQIFKALAKIVGDISIEKAERLIKTIPDDNLTIALRRKLVFTLTNEKIIKPKCKTLQKLPFIGRDEDIQKILDKLQREQFFAITGTIGVGKSELAYQVAQEVERTRLFPSVKIIYLENKDSTEDAIKDIHRELQQLPPNALVILDNCEHLKAFTEAIDQLRRKHTQLTILATSSIAMTVSDYPIEPLQTNDAIQLFLEAAKKVVKNFTLTEEDTPKVRELCIGLDSLPLALLLAAGLLIYETFNQVHTWAKENGLLDAANRFSETERHRDKTLSILFEKIYELLKPDDQKLFRRLAIFAGACYWETVAAVCIINKDLPEQEQQLKNLLMRLADHYLMFYTNGWADIAHNTIKAYARRKLDKEDDKEQIETQYLDYYHDFLKKGDDLYSLSEKEESEAEKKARESDTVWMIYLEAFIWGGSLGEWWTRAQQDEENLRDAYIKLNKRRTALMDDALRFHFGEKRYQTFLQSYKVHKDQQLYDFGKDFLREYSEEEDFYISLREKYSGRPRLNLKQKIEARRFEQVKWDIGQKIPYRLCDATLDDELAIAENNYWESKTFGSLIIGFLQNARLSTIIKSFWGF